MMTNSRTKTAARPEAAVARVRPQGRGASFPGTQPADLQRRADASPVIQSLMNLQARADTLVHSNAPVQRVLDADLAGINQSYLSRFASRFVALTAYSARLKVLAELQSSSDTFGSDEALLAGLPGILTAAGLDPTMATGSGDEAVSLPDIAAQTAPRGAAPPPSAPEEPVVLSTAPAQAGPSRGLSPSEAYADPAPESGGSRHVVDLYGAGRLLVTSIQRAHLAGMHNAEANARVASHISEDAMRMDNADLDPGGDLEHAKVNWTLTSPHMQPHYYGMMDDSDRTPKMDSIFSKPRVATLADPEAMGARFMRGKTGAEDFGDWDADQASGKSAGVRSDQPLFDFMDDGVSARFDAIRTAQESGYLAQNPEINTFGFPPDAIVGFLVTSGNALDMDALIAAKLAMSAKQQKRSFPVFTWEQVTDRQWTLVLLGHV